MRNDDKYEHFTKGFEKTDSWKDKGEVRSTTGVYDTVWKQKWLKGNRCRSY